MDRERLKEVHQTDLTESRVNEEFVDWLKNKGPTWLLAVLAAVCAYLAVVRFKQHKVTKLNDGWAAFFMADLPGAYEDVARDFPGVGELPNTARLSAAGKLMRSVQTGLALGAADPTSAAAPVEDLLSEDERTQFLARADGLYDTVLETDDGSPGRTLFAVQAMSGKAAVAEARQDLATASSWYAKSAERAESVYPGLAEQARRRAESTPKLELALTFRSAADIAQERATPTPRDPVVVDPALRDLIMPPDESSG